MSVIDLAAARRDRERSERDRQLFTLTRGELREIVNEVFAEWVEAERRKQIKLVEGERKGSL